MKLIIVESYQKTKILKRYFKGDTIISCNGHIVDLDPKTLSIEKKKNQYIPKYTFLNEYKNKFIQNLKKQKNKYDEIILASDFDNEGEFIAHSLKTYLDLKKYNRIVFHSLAKRDLEDAFLKKSKINDYIVHSQQTRRMIDRLIGYKIQRILGKQFSIGRNQAIVLQFIKNKCENYEKKKTIYEVTIGNDKNQTRIVELNHKLKGKKIEILKKYSESKYEFPHPLLNTSSVQILAYQQHKIDPFVCTKILNELYNSGLITYIRTDAEVINPGFIEHCVSKMQNTFDMNFSNIKKLKSKYKTSSKPHEAIRPVNYSIPQNLSGNHKKIFELIYYITIENFLHPVFFESNFVDIKIENTIKKLKIKEKIVKQGFNKIRKIRKPIQPFSVQGLKILKCEKKEKRLDFLYTKTSLIKEMKSKKVATPSTYDYSIKQLIQKKYINNNIYITQKGLFLLQFIAKYFPKFINISFIQNMYKNIDLIQNQQIDLNSVIEEVDNYINSQIEKIPVNYNLTKKWITTKTV